MVKSTSHIALHPITKFEVQQKSAFFIICANFNTIRREK